MTLFLLGLIVVLGALLAAALLRGSVPPPAPPKPVDPPLFLPKAPAPEPPKVAVARPVEPPPVRRWEPPVAPPAPVAAPAPKPKPVPVPQPEPVVIPPDRVVVRWTSASGHVYGETVIDRRLRRPQLKHLVGKKEREKVFLASHVEPNGVWVYREVK